MLGALGRQVSHDHQGGVIAAALLKHGLDRNVVVAERPHRRQYTRLVVHLEADIPLGLDILEGDKLTRRQPDPGRDLGAGKDLSSRVDYVPKNGSCCWLSGRMAYCSYSKL